MSTAKVGGLVNESAAQAEFTEYFVKNYPGPNTIICDPTWHAPRIFRAAQRALSAHGQPVVDEAMVGRALSAKVGRFTVRELMHLRYGVDEKAMHAALTAALAGEAHE